MSRQLLHRVFDYVFDSVRAHYDGFMNTHQFNRFYPIRFKVTSLVMDNNNQIASIFHYLFTLNILNTSKQ